MSQNQKRPFPQHFAAKTQQISAEASRVEARIIAKGLTVRDMAIVADLMQQKIDVYDEMLDNPPIIQLGETDE